MGEPRDIAVYLNDIYESAELIIDYCKKITEEEFYQSTEKQDAILRRIQIIGDAAKRIPEKDRANWSHIPWKKIAGMRDIVVHEYFGVTLAMVWQVAVQDIPELKDQIAGMLNNYK